MTDLKLVRLPNHVTAFPLRVASQILRHTSLKDGYCHLPDNRITINGVLYLANFLYDSVWEVTDTPLNIADINGSLNIEEHHFTFAFVAFVLTHLPS